MTTVALTLLAFLLGSVPFALIVSRAFGLADPRSYGSRNPGATNVLRTGNKLAAALTLVGDAAKGWLAVWLAMHFGPRFGGTGADVALVSVCVFLGHVFSVFLKFKGGKGVATAAGVLLGLKPMLGLAVLAVWVSAALMFRYSSLAAVIAAGFAPFAALKLFGADEHFAAVVAMSALLVARHADNIKRLVRGEETRLGQKKNQSPSDSN